MFTERATFIEIIIKTIIIPHISFEDHFSLKINSIIR
jgi:hypothetical protein